MKEIKVLPPKWPLYVFEERLQEEEGEGLNTTFVSVVCTIKTRGDNGTLIENSHRVGFEGDANLDDLIQFVRIKLYEELKKNMSYELHFSPEEVYRIKRALHTGDIGYLDEGLLLRVGRKLEQ